MMGDKTQGGSGLEEECLHGGWEGVVGAADCIQATRRTETGGRRRTPVPIKDNSGHAAGGGRKDMPSFFVLLPKILLQQK